MYVYIYILLSDSKLQDKSFDFVNHGSLKEGNLRWFVNGRLNASVQCLDRHIENGNGDKVALIWDSDEVGEGRSFTYNEVLDSVGLWFSLLKNL